MNARRTFQVVDDYGHIDDHLRVILSDTEKYPEEVVIASFSIYKPGKDPACIVKREEHPTWLTKENSCISYKHLTVTSLTELYAAKDMGLIQLLDDVSESLFLRICKGAGDSTETEPDIADLLIAQGVIRLDE